ncbi:xanthine dehydrogenase family protein molybdopterin-binding subunit [Tunturiibacter gelidoferens]|uniref:Xanthine dehydrogenase YagR molybdenum-binding subunit n=1 Tax=Tunturiibacter lichenicola TaxID=2051959 RepID=A0A7Y9NLN7_9BACT|nr:xanthine dehydrogenase family protein molybdopterin-binding subunit [Edaphobacter lichenicola]NYF51532.1 xanthine dehydrogenase YagR molybdenum-binding subunit [Edaphobacter lichenicola]
MDQVTESKVIGVATPRIDGPLKVSGSAMYASDYNFPGLLYAWPVCATISNGTMTHLDTVGAEKMPGVIAVYHRENIGKLYRVPPSTGFTLIIDEKRPPFEDDTIRYYGQYVAVVVAQTVEQARAAAESVKVTYNKEKPDTGEKLLGTPLTTDKPDEKSKRGDTAAALKVAKVKVDAVYKIPVETHNPIELHASVAVFDGKKYTLYETSQAVVNHRDVMAQMLGVPTEQVQVITRFLGSGFGGKLWPWPHGLLAAACARNLGRPVKLVVSRQMMFQSVGHRPAIDQRIQLAAEPDGKLTAVQQDYVNHTSMLDDYDEGCGEITPFLYSTPNLLVTGGLARRNVGNPTAMRGPGAVPGLFALESAMDELAIALKMDPVQLRLKNEPALDESLNIPFSSRHMKECLTVGAEKFGWAKRTPEIGSMKRDGLTLGWGMAACSWLAARIETEATVELLQDGSARVACGTQDIGGGTYTVMAQVVSHETGIPVNRIDVVLGDSSLPPGPISGGSWVTASMTPAVLGAAQNAGKALLLAAIKSDGSPFKGKKQEDLELVNGTVRLKGQGQDAVPMAEILRIAKVNSVSGTNTSDGTFGAAKPKVSFHSYGAQFAEVTWQPEIARLRVSRVVTVIDAGRILNPRPARNQIEGAVVMGVGMALFEETMYDARSGAPINNNLADYVVAVNADTPDIDVTFLDYPDYQLNALGARGVGEIGLAGIAAAITNAVYHATGIRVRDLPVRIEDLLVPASKTTHLA